MTQANNSIKNINSSEPVIKISNLNEDLNQSLIDIVILIDQNILNQSNISIE